jgi:hypothetical protein
MALELKIACPGKFASPIFYVNGTLTDNIIGGGRLIVNANAVDYKVSCSLLKLSDSNVYGPLESNVFAFIAGDSKSWATTLPFDVPVDTDYVLTATLYQDGNPPILQGTIASQLIKTMASGGNSCDTTSLELKYNDPNLEVSVKPNNSYTATDKCVVLLYQIVDGQNQLVFTKSYAYQPNANEAVINIAAAASGQEYFVEAIITDANGNVKNKLTGNVTKD